MARLIVTSEDLGKGLKVENKKVVVDVADLELPVDVHIDNATYNPQTGNLEFTFTGVKQPVEVQLAQALGVNTKVKSFAVEAATANLVITDTDNTEFKLDLTSVLATAGQAAVQEANRYTDTQVNALKGDEAVSLGGVVLGRFVAN